MTLTPDDERLDRICARDEPSVDRGVRGAARPRMRASAGGVAPALSFTPHSHIQPATRPGLPSTSA